MDTQPGIAQAAGDKDEDEPVTFLDLPRELRDEIYLYAGVAPPVEFLELCCDGQMEWNEGCKIHGRDYFQPLATLLLVNRQVHVEVWETFRKHAYFVVYPPIWGILPEHDQGEKIFQSGLRCSCPQILASMPSKISVMAKRWCAQEKAPAPNRVIKEYCFFREGSLKFENGEWSCCVFQSPFDHEVEKAMPQAALDEKLTKAANDMYDGLADVTERRLTYGDIDSMTKVLQSSMRTYGASKASLDDGWMRTRYEWESKESGYDSESSEDSEASEQSDY